MANNMISLGMFACMYIRDSGKVGVCNQLFHTILFAFTHFLTFIDLMRVKFLNLHQLKSFEKTTLYILNVESETPTAFSRPILQESLMNID